MKYLVFTLWFTLIHIVSYSVAGMFALKISKDIYESKSRLMDYLRDMSDNGESKHVQKLCLPGQIVRGILLSVVLFPIYRTFMRTIIGNKISVFYRFNVYLHTSGLCFSLFG